MSPRWDDVNARARGLGSRLLSPPGIRALAAVHSIGELAARLERHGYPMGGIGPTPGVAELDRLIGLVAGARMGLLARWLGPRVRRVRGLFEQADRDALRAIARGVAQGAAPSTILLGLTPSPTLSGRALQGLAQATSFDDLGRRLARMHHPYAAVFTRRAETAPKGSALLEVELGLRRCFAERVREGARRGGTQVRRLATEVVDHENLVTLLLADAWGVELSPQELFIRGGRILFRERFLAIAGQPDPEGRRTSLVRAFRATMTGTMLADPGLNVAGLELGMRRGRLGAARRAMRADPLSVWVLVYTALRIDAEAHNLRRILRALSLGAPPDAITTGLVEAG